MKQKRLFRVRRGAAVFAAAAFIISSSLVALAKDFRVGELTIEQPWSRAAPIGATVAAGYFIIKNAGDAQDRLISVTASIAGHTGIHQMSMSDGMMQMRELREGLVIPAQGSVTLQPGSHHLMFEDLKRQLKEGETFSGTLAFEKAGKADVTFEVRGLGAGTPSTHPSP
jgi:copper(I)-binding protein